MLGPSPSLPGALSPAQPARALLARVLIPIVSVATLALLAPPAEAAAAPVRWALPVQAPVVDWFRPPTSPYGSGNRGLEFATVGGETVTAVAEGTVTFAGKVGSSAYVVVAHGQGPDGSGRVLRSTSAYLDRVEVSAGDRVLAGQRLGTADKGFHLTARIGGTYIDPAPLLGLSSRGHRIRLRRRYNHRLASLASRAGQPIPTRPTMDGSESTVSPPGTNWVVS